MNGVWPGGQNNVLAVDCLAHAVRWLCLMIAVARSGHSLMSDPPLISHFTEALSCNCWKKLIISVVGVRKKLGRVSRMAHHEMTEVARINSSGLFSLRGVLNNCKNIKSLTKRFGESLTLPCRVRTHKING